MQTITTIGFDIAKSVFQVHGVDTAGEVVIRRQSIFGRFALATGPQEIVRMGKMGKGNMRVRTGLPPWRRSADRTSLQANSLVSGNFTGNFAISGLREPIPEQETAALQRFPQQFPKQINRGKYFNDQGISTR